MKIKHPKEHDQIVHWILNNPETLLTNLGFKAPFTDLKKHIQTNVMKNKTIIGNFDVQLKFQCADDFENLDLRIKSYVESSEAKPNRMHRNISVNIIVNVKMESATEQLRELKKLYNQHIENTSGHNHAIQKYAIVSTNDTFKTFFTDAGFIFYTF